MGYGYSIGASFGTFLRLTVKKLCHPCLLLCLDIYAYYCLFAQIENPLQRHGGRLEHNETYCGSCYGAETVRIS